MRGSCRRTQHRPASVSFSQDAAARTHTCTHGCWREISQELKAAIRSCTLLGCDRRSAQDLTTLEGRPGRRGRAVRTRRAPSAAMQDPLRRCGWSLGPRAAPGIGHQAAVDLLTGQPLTYIQRPAVTGRHTGRPTMSPCFESASFSPALCKMQALL